MPTKRKIDDVKLKRMVKDGKSIKHCACHFGVCQTASKTDPPSASNIDPLRA